VCLLMIVTGHDGMLESSSHVRGCAKVPAPASRTVVDSMEMLGSLPRPGQGKG